MNFLQQIKEWFTPFIGVVSTFSITDLLDILCVSFLIYHGLRLARQTRAEQLLKGILILVVAYGLSVLLRLQALNFILQNIFQIGVLALVIVFQPEFRRALEHVGRSKIGSFGGGFHMGEGEWQNTIDSICRACDSMQNSKTGALIVIERKTMLGDIANTGTVVDAKPTMELFLSIFFPNSALHDGALIVRGAKIYAAGCILPLTQSSLAKELGTRHRAAVGISENSDAVTVVVSEETGMISVAMDGKLTRNLNMASLHILLEQELLEKPIQDGEGVKKPFWKAWFKK